MGIYKKINLPTYSNDGRLVTFSAISNHNIATFNKFAFLPGQYNYLNLIKVLSFAWAWALEWDRA